MISHVFFDDCMSVMTQFPDNYFDWAVCDVPYGINTGKMPYLQQDRLAKKQRNGSTLYVTKKKYAVKSWDEKPPGQDYFDEVKRVSKNQIIFGIEYVKWDGVGTGRIKWIKHHAQGLSFKNYEMAYCSSINHTHVIELLWHGMLQAKSLSEPFVQQGNKKLNEVRIHPCQKPVLLYDKIYRDFCFKGMKVLDTHLGSGSSRISADKFGISEFIGVENDSESFRLHQQRWSSYKSVLKLFD